MIKIVIYFTPCKVDTCKDIEPEAIVKSINTLTYKNPHIDRIMIEHD